MQMGIQKEHYKTINQIPALAGMTNNKLWQKI